MSMIPISPTNIWEGTNAVFYTSTNGKPGSPVGPFLDQNGEPFDPDIVEFSFVVFGEFPQTNKYYAGSGDPKAVITRLGVGEYCATIPTTGQVGRWVWRWAGYPNPAAPANPNAAAIEGVINVLANDVNPDAN